VAKAEIAATEPADTKAAAAPATPEASKSASAPAARADAPNSVAAKADAKGEAEPPRPEVKIDTAKVDAELAALRAALAKGELDDK
jgi:hypothetical protein